MMTVLFCADLCKNHAGDMTAAVRMTKAACDAGVDIVKLQADDGLDKEMHARIFDIAHDCGAKTAITVREPSDVSNYEDADYLKIGSGECLNTRLIAKVRQDSRPWIISTGGTTREQFDSILEQASEAYAVCECTSSYPEMSNEARLGFMASSMWPNMGYSDHMPNIHIALAAVALGAIYVEKHFTLFPMLLSENHSSSIGQVELAQLVREGQEIHTALQNRQKEVLPRELTTGKLLEYRGRYLKLAC